MPAAFRQIFISFFQAKTDEQITKEKQWLDTQKVWLMHRGGFALARKISGPEVEPGKVRIQLEQTGDHLNVDEDDIETVRRILVWI